MTSVPQFVHHFFDDEEEEASGAFVPQEVQNFPGVTELPHFVQNMMIPSKMIDYFVTMR